jgi:hypothetical protein
MVNCDFCGKKIRESGKKKKEAMLSDGNYCDECSDKGINELYEEILDDKGNKIEDEDECEDE